MLYDACCSLRNGFSSTAVRNPANCTAVLPGGCVDGLVGGCAGWHIGGCVGAGGTP